MVNSKILGFLLKQSQSQGTVGLFSIIEQSIFGLHDIDDLSQDTVGLFLIISQVIFLFLDIKYHESSFSRNFLRYFLTKSQVSSGF